MYLPIIIVKLDIWKHKYEYMHPNMFDFHSLDCKLAHMFELQIRHINPQFRNILKHILTMYSIQTIMDLMDTEEHSILILDQPNYLMRIL